MSNAWVSQESSAAFPRAALMPPFGRAGMTPGRVELRDDADVGACVVSLDRRAHSGTAGADDEDVVRSFHSNGR